jgi:hypothetical protein
MTDAFSPSQYSAVTDRLNAGLDTIPGKLQDMRDVAHQVMDHWYIPRVVQDSLIGLVVKFGDLVKSIVDKIGDALKGIAAPVTFFFDALQWTDARGLVNGVAGELGVDRLSAPLHWKGNAADAYSRVAKQHSAAATQVGVVADKTKTALYVCAGAGLAFYVTLGIIAFQFIDVLIAAIAAIASGVFSWAGLAAGAADAGVTAGMVWAAVTALTSLLGLQAQQMIEGHGAVVDPGAFPDGQWPKVGAESYGDASVKDGDVDWSIKG